MANGIRSFSPRSYGLFPQGVKWLLISNISLFIIYFFCVQFGYGWIWAPFALVPGEVLRALGSVATRHIHVPP